MDKNLITHYKLQLAHDLILFLGKLCVHGLPLEMQIEKVDQIIKTWDDRVHTQINVMRNAKVKEMCEQSGEDYDVQKILMNISSIEPEAIRKEFKIEAKRSMLRPFNKQKT